MSVKEEASRAGNRYAPAFIATKHSEREFRPLIPQQETRPESASCVGFGILGRA